MLKPLASLVLLSLVMAPRAGAQGFPGAGERVRIRQTNGVIVSGVLEIASPEGLQIRDGVDEALLLIPVRSVRTLEKSLGQQRKFGRNFGLTVAGTSFAVGVGGLIAQGCDTSEPEGEGSEATTRCHFGDSKVRAIAGGSALGALLGAPIGLLIGLTATEERWTRVPLPGTRSAWVRPVVSDRGGVALQLTW